MMSIDTQSRSNTVQPQNCHMPMRQFGSDRLRVSAIGLGLAALGRPAYINVGRDLDLGTDRSRQAMERRCHDVLDAAYAAGVRYIDAARSYGLAEEFLASWLETFERRHAPSELPTVGSKWGYAYVGNWEMDAKTHEIKDLSAANLHRQVGESRALLGGHLNLYQIHSATIESRVLDDAAVLDGLAALRASGLVIGLSVSGPQQRDTIRKALEVRVNGINPFQAVQATWNLLESSAGVALAEAHDAGWGVIVKEGLANGQLTDRERTHLPAAIVQAADSAGTGVDALALATILSQPWADVVLSGAVTPEQLHDNLNALDAPPFQAWSETAQEPEHYWTRRSRFGWG